MHEHTYNCCLSSGFMRFSSSLPIKHVIVNLRSRPGRISDTCITVMFLGNRGWEGQHGWPFETYVFVERSQETSAKRSRQLVTQRQKKQRSQPTVEANRATEEQEESKVESKYWRFFTSQVFRLTLHVTVLWTTTNRATRDTCAVCPIHAAWRLEQREACVVLVFGVKGY